MLSPLVPMLGVMLCGWDIGAAFLLGIVFLARAVPAGPGETIQRLARSSIEGLHGVSSAVALMMGIGMLVVALSSEPVTEALRPWVRASLPVSAAGYVLAFGLAAPLALYRGPLNVWGMGFGLVAVVHDAAVLAPMRIVAAFLSTGQIQGVCDPTNTHNVWIANQLGLGLTDILWRSLPYVWTLAILGLILGASLW